MGWIIAIVAVVVLQLFAAGALVQAGAHIGVRGRRLVSVGLKAVLPGFMVGALNDLLRYSEEAVETRDFLGVDGRFRELAAAFDRDTASEHHTLGGGFRGVGLKPWFIALFAVLLALAPGPGSQGVPVAAAIVFLMVFPTLYRAGDSALDTLGIGQGMLFYGGVVWVVFAGLLQTLIGTVVKVLLGTVWGPVHVLLYAFKGARFARLASDELRRGSCSARVQA